MSFEHVSALTKTAIFVTRCISGGVVAEFFWLPGGLLRQMADLSEGVI